MGGGLVSPPPELKTMGEIFREQCSYYLVMGMSYEDYWEGPCDMVTFYRESWAIKRRVQNYEAWLQGRYIYTVLCQIAPLYDLFGKHRKPEPYLSEPFPISENDKEEQDQRKEQEMIERGKRWMEQFAAAFNKTFKGGGESNGC